MSIMASSPAWNSSGGILSTPADVPSSALCLFLPPLFVKWNDARRMVSVGNQVPLGPHRSHSCKVQLLGISSSFVTLFRDLVLYGCLTSWYAFSLLFI